MLFWVFHLCVLICPVSDAEAILVIILQLDFILMQREFYIAG